MLLSRCLLLLSLLFVSLTSHSGILMNAVNQWRLELPIISQETTWLDLYSEASATLSALNSAANIVDNPYSEPAQISDFFCFTPARQCPNEPDRETPSAPPCPDEQDAADSPDTSSQVSSALFAYCQSKGYFGNGDNPDGINQNHLCENCDRYYTEDGHRLCQHCEQAGVEMDSCAMCKNVRPCRSEQDMGNVCYTCVPYRFAEPTAEAQPVATQQCAICGNHDTRSNMVLSSCEHLAYFHSHCFLQSYSMCPYCRFAMQQHSQPSTPPAYASNGIPHPVRPLTVNPHWVPTDTQARTIGELLNVLSSDQQYAFEDFLLQRIPETIRAHFRTDNFPFSAALQEDLRIDIRCWLATNKNLPLGRLKETLSSHFISVYLDKKKKMKAKTSCFFMHCFR